jgi:nucleoside-diphosphate-sugar epimerase
VSDLLDAYDMAISAKIPSGKYTVGGGLENYVSFVGAVRRMGGEIAKFEPARPKDQQFFIAESDSLRYFGWRPKVSASEISKLTSI